MEKYLFSIDFISSLALFTGVLLAALSWYYWRVLVPFAEFPSYRLDYRLLKWFLTVKKSKREPMTKFIFQSFVDACKTYETEGLCVVWAGEPLLMVYGEEAVKAFINEPEAADKAKRYDVFDFALRQGIFLSNGEIYKNQKRLISPLFHGNALKGMLPNFNRHAELLVEKLSGMEEIIDSVSNVVGYLKSKSAFDSKLGSEVDDNKLLSMIKKADKLCKFTIHRMFSPWLYWDFTLKFSSYGRKSLKIYEELTLTFKEILENIKQSVISRKAESTGAESDIRKSFGEILIEHHLRDPSFTLQDVMYQINNLITAGFDTMPNTMMWCLFLLGHHEDVQEQVYQEIVSVTEGDIHSDDLRDLKYLESILKETLRLYPAGPLFGRHLKKEVKFGKYKVPKNTTIVFFPYALHRNPNVYSDPEKFDPDRFVRGNPEIKPWTHIPFAEGVRPCIGKNYAMMLMKVILSHILRNFRVISLDRKEDVEVSWEIFLVCTKRLRLQFVPRSEA